MASSSLPVFTNAHHKATNSLNVPVVIPPAPGRPLVRLPDDYHAVCDHKCSIRDSSHTSGYIAVCREMDVVVTGAPPRRRCLC